MNFGIAVRTHEAQERARTRREKIWAWLSLAALVICWDACLRLDTRVSIPRPRLAHAVEREAELRDEFTEK